MSTCPNGECHECKHQGVCSFPYERIAYLESALADERKRREGAEEERNTALSALNTERTMREAAAAALTEWHGGIKQGQRIIDAEAYKRLWKETKANNARLREALESTLRALQKAINGNQMDGSWLMAELEARDALNHKFEHVGQADCGGNNE